MIGKFYFLKLLIKELVFSVSWIIQETYVKKDSLIIYAVKTPILLFFLLNSQLHFSISTAFAYREFMWYQKVHSY